MQHTARIERCDVTRLENHIKCKCIVIMQQLIISESLDEHKFHCQTI